MFKTELDKLLFEPPPIGCVLYMPGLPQGGGVIHDRSPYGNHGTITGATWTRMSSGLWCLDLDGTDDVINCGTNASILLGAFTFKVWAKSDLSWEAATNYLLGWHTTAGYPSIGFYGNTKPALYMGASNYRLFVVQPAGFDWRHLVFTLTGAAQADINNGAFYSNGVSQTVDTTLATGAQSAKTICYIGRRGTGSFWDGKLALPELLTSVWTAAQVMSSFQQERHLFGV